MTPESPAEAAIREAARSAFDEAAEEEVSQPVPVSDLHPEGPNPTSPPYPAPVGEIASPPRRATLPGGGKRGPGCGAKLAVGWISYEDGCLPTGIYSCDRRVCPRCAKAHAAKDCEFGMPHGGGDIIHEEAGITGAKLMGYARSVGRPLRQDIVSPDPSRYSEDADQGETIAAVRLEVRKALSELGWCGSGWGSVTVHLNRGCEAEGYNRWGPHGHVVGGGIDARKTEEYAARTGVVVKQVNDSETGGFASYWGGKLHRHLVYELGHAPTVPHGHSVSYVGPGLIAYVPKTCARCGALLPDDSKDRLCPRCLESAEEEPKTPTCPHGHELKVLGTGARPRYDELTREWTYPAEHGEFFRFLDRAPAQGGPILERVRRDGRAIQVTVSPYRAGDLRPPPYAGPKRRPFTISPTGEGSPEGEPPDDGPSFTEGGFAWATRNGACVACCSRWKSGDGEVRCPHLPSARDPDEEYEDRARRELGSSIGDGS